ERMDSFVLPRLKGLDRSDWVEIDARSADLETFDFAPLTLNATSILVFWDAHGFGVATGVLCTLMPLIADDRHLVVCHDMADNRVSVPREYNGLAFWRGMEDWYAAPEKRARVNIGWTHTVVDQVIPIVDFCHRNSIEFHSVDFDMHLAGDPAKRVAVAERLC